MHYSFSLKGISQLRSIRAMEQFARVTGLSSTPAALTF
jgi:hypothetical protein